MKNNTPNLSYFSNTCPKCKKGKVFEQFLWMNANCPECGHHFEKEEGYFIGAMIIAYFSSAFLALPILLISVFKYNVGFPEAPLMACTQVIITGPIFYRYSKLVWIQLEHRLSRSFDSKKAD